MYPGFDLQFKVILKFNTVFGLNQALILKELSLKTDGIKFQLSKQEKGMSGKDWEIERRLCCLREMLIKKVS